MKFEPLEHRSDKWYAARLGHPTASNFHRIMQPKRLILSDQRYLYAGELIAERIFKRPMEKDISHYKEVQWGIDHEDEAAQAMGQRLPGTLRPGGFFSDDRGRYGASPDRLLIHGNRREVCEIKCPYEIPRHVRNLLFGMPDEHYTQVQGQLLLTGFDTAHFWSYHPDCPSYHERVEPDEKFIRALRNCLEEFCAELDEQEARAREMGAWKVEP